MTIFSKKKLIEEIMAEGQVLRLHSGAVAIIAEKTAEQVAKWVEKRSVVTKDDINQKVAKELKKYNSDLAYVYQNRGKII